MLSRSRPYGMGGPLPIAVSEAMAVLHMEGVPRDDWSEWVFLLQELDRVWLQNAAKDTGK
jgi:hypothetical protein